jgi:hypothetical protein
LGLNLKRTLEKRRKDMLLEKNKTPRTLRPPVVLTLLIGGLLALIIAHASSAHAQKYSPWSTPVNLGPLINSAFSDQGPAISKDGLSLYFTSDRPGGLGGPFDMYVSQRASVDDPWGAPMNLGPTVNTIFDEGNPALSRDGHLLFFQSKRPGGLGGIDLWFAYREHTHDDFDWQTPVNLGPGVNSAADDNGPSYFENEEDGLPQLYFGSARPGGLGAADIYLSEQMADGSFGPAVRVTELSSSLNENRPSIRHNGLEIFFQSNRPGSLSTALDLWVASRASTLDEWSTPTNLGSTINTTAIDNNAYLSSDGKTLLFSSDRPGGFGGLDLYMTTRMKLHEQSSNVPTRTYRSKTRPVDY